MWLFYCFVMFPCTNLLEPPPSPHALFHVWKKEDLQWYVHSSDCACAPESCVYFPRCWTCKLVFSSLLFFCAGPKSNFPRFFPSFLPEKSEVICKLCPFQPTQNHAAVSSEYCGALARTRKCTCSGKPKEKGFLKITFSSVMFPFGLMCNNVSSYLDRWDLNMVTLFML